MRGKCHHDFSVLYLQECQSLLTVMVASIISNDKNGTTSITSIQHCRVHIDKLAWQTFAFLAPFLTASLIYSTCCCHSEVEVSRPISLPRGHWTFFATPAMLPSPPVPFFAMKLLLRSTSDSCSCRQAAFHFPCLAWFHQLYKVAWLMPSNSDTSSTEWLWGGNILFSTAAFRSSE